MTACSGGVLASGVGDPGVQEKKIPGWKVSKASRSQVGAGRVYGTPVIAQPGGRVMIVLEAAVMSHPLACAAGDPVTARARCTRAEIDGRIMIVHQVRPLVGSLKGGRGWAVFPRAHVWVSLSLSLVRSLSLVTVSLVTVMSLSLIPYSYLVSASRR
jgi:hypothetical protein